LNYRHFRADIARQNGLVKGIGFLLPVGKKSCRVAAERVFYDLIAEPEINGFRFSRPYCILIDRRELGSRLFLPEHVDILFVNNRVMKGILYKRSLVGRPGDFFKVGLILGEKTVLRGLKV
jgi:hypothetical protein